MWHQCKTRWSVGNTTNLRATNLLSLLSANIQNSLDQQWQTNRLQEPEQISTASSPEVSIPRALWLSPGQNANLPQTDLQPVHDRRPLGSFQQKTSLLAYHGLRQVTRIIQLTHKYSISCSLSNIAFDCSNLKQLDSIFQWTTKIRNLLSVQKENVSLDQIENSTRRYLLSSCHIPGTYLSSDKKYISSLYRKLLLMRPAQYQLLTTSMTVSQAK